MPAVSDPPHRPRAASRVDARTARILGGPLGLTVFSLAWPPLGEQLLNSAVSFVDIWLAGHLPESVDADAVAVTTAVGFAAYVSWLGSMVATLIGIGTGALVSRFWGSGRRRAAGLVMNRSVALSFVLGSAFAGLIAWQAEAIARLLADDDLVLETTVRFLRLETLGYPALTIGLIAAAALRGAGDMLTPLLILIGINAVNCVTSFWLSLVGLPGGGPLGADGIVAGTVVARWAGAAAILAFLATGRSGLRLDPRQWKLWGPTVRRVVRIGAPAAMDSMVFWTGQMLFLWIIAQVGEAALAAHFVDIRIESLTYLSATAFGAAAATLIGQNLGAKHDARARRGGHVAALQAVAFAVGVSVLFILAADRVLAVMTDSEDVRAAALPPLRLVGWFQVPLAMSIVYVAALRGAGQTRLPVLITATTTYAVRLPLAWLLAVEWGYGLTGAWAAMCADMLLRGVFAWGLYSRLRWERTRV